jgi:hypothetical protein
MNERYQIERVTRKSLSSEWLRVDTQERSSAAHGINIASLP